MTLVKDYVAEPAPIRVRVAAAPVADAIVALWASVAEASDIDSFVEVDQIRSMVDRLALPEPDAQWMAEGSGALWAALIPLVDSLEAASVGEMAEAILAMDAEAVVARMERDLDGCEPCTLPDLSDAAGTKTRLLGVLRRVSDRLDDVVTDIGPIVRHDAELTRFLARRMDTERLIETITNGIAYRPEAGVTEIVLIPSVMIRPWNLMFRFGDVRYFIYPASDEAMAADDDTPPSWMVQLFKALGDDKRLRLLRRIGDGPQTLGDLADCLDLAKSTTHHHLRLLRAAGLVRLVVRGIEKEETTYELRDALLPEALTAIQAYLGGDHPEE